MPSWEQLPKDAGQMVDVRYDIDWEAGILWQRTEDRSGGGVVIRRATIHMDGDDVRYEPQNGVLPPHGPWRGEFDKGGE